MTKSSRFTASDKQYFARRRGEGLTDFFGPNGDTQPDEVGRLPRVKRAAAEARYRASTGVILVQVQTCQAGVATRPRN